MIGDKKYEQKNTGKIESAKIPLPGIRYRILNITLD